MSAPSYCRDCGYRYPDPAKPNRCRCPPDFGAEREVERSAGYAGGGIGRHGSSQKTTDYQGEIDQ